MGKPLSENFEKLIRRAQKGDQPAFDFLYQQYLKPIFRFFYLRLNSRYEAEDLTQTVFIKAWQALKNFKFQKKPLLAWLYTISRHALIDFQRKKKEILIGDKPLPIKENIPSPDNHQKELAEKINQAIKELTPEQQEVVILKFIEDKSNAEIAQILDKNEEAVRSLCYRAIKSLKNKLKEQSLL